MGNRSEFVVTNGRIDTKIHFIKFIEPFVRIHKSEKSYLTLCNKVTGEKEPLGFSGFNSAKVRKGVLIEDPEIYINEADFVFDDGSDYRDLTKYVILHEITEVWIHAVRGIKRTKAQMDSDDACWSNHRRSLIEEWAKAVKQGDGNRYWDLMVRVSQRLDSENGREMLEENERVYRKVRAALCR